VGDLDRAAYLRHRFGGSQRIVRWREERMVAALLARLEGSLSCVLDAPCGHGRFTAQLRAATRGLLVSADSDPRHLRALRSAESPAYLPDLVELDLRSPLPFGDRTFDLVFTVRFLHHVREQAWRERLLEDLVRVSRRYVLVSYYEAGSLHSLQKALQHALKPKRGRRLAMVRRSELLRSFDAMGCRVVSDSAILPGLHAHRLVLLERR
jgi:SAM-dependent methyltransferase